MPTVRLRDASEYPEAARKLFELSSVWFKHDFAQPPASGGNSESTSPSDSG
jgi:hypothetical protein